MYVTKLGWGVNATSKKGEQDNAISNQHWVCKFEEIGYASKQKRGNYCALSHELMGG